jgi:hypothetical protein
MFQYGELGINIPTRIIMVFQWVVLLKHLIIIKDIYINGNCMSGYLSDKPDLFKNLINSFEISRKETKMKKYVRHNKGLYNWENFCSWFKDTNPYLTLHEFLFSKK